MTQTPSMIIIGAQPQEDLQLRSRLAGLADVRSSTCEAMRGPELAREHHPEVVLLYLDHQPDAILNACSQISRINGCTPMIVSREKNPDQIVLAMRAGAKEFAYLDSPGEDEVRQAVIDLARHRVAHEVSRAGKVVAVFSCKGGSGATTIATNLAFALNRGGSADRTVLLDADFQMGDVLVYLDMPSRYNWSHLLDNMHRLDDELLRETLTRHPAGLHVVAQSDEPDEGDQIKPQDVQRVLTFLRQQFSFLVIDGLRDFNETALAALDLADQVLVTMTPDIPSLKNARRCLSIFSQLDYGPDKLKLVLNRYHRRCRLDPDSIADALNMTISSTITNDYPTAIKATNEGSLLLDVAPRARITRDIENLVNLLDDAQAPLRKGLFSFLGKTR